MVINRTIGESCFTYNKVWFEVTQTKSSNVMGDAFVQFDLKAMQSLVKHEEAKP